MEINILRVILIWKLFVTKRMLSILFISRNGTIKYDNRLILLSHHMHLIRHCRVFSLNSVSDSMSVRSASVC